MDMNGIDIVTLFAIILFARLGIRLIKKYYELKNEGKEDSESYTNIDEPRN